MYLPKVNFRKKQARKKGSNQAFYKSARWKKTRLAYLSQFPLCEIADYCDEIEPGEVVDHIIPISMGGAKFDPRNFCTMCKKLHDIKSSLEQKGVPLVDYTRNMDGDYIPVEKSEIWRVLEKRYRYEAQKG